MPEVLSPCLHRAFHSTASVQAGVDQVRRLGCDVSAVESEEGWFIRVVASDAITAKTMALRATEAALLEALAPRETGRD